MSKFVIIAITLAVMATIIFGTGTTVLQYVNAIVGPGPSGPGPSPGDLEQQLKLAKEKISNAKQQNGAGPGASGPPR